MKRKKESVLNSDLFDHYTYEKIYQSSKKLQGITGQQEYPYFKALQQDVWSSLYKVNPQIEEDVEQELLGNQRLMQNVMTDEAYSESRPNTTLDTLYAAISSLLFTEKIAEWLEEMKKEPDVQKAYEDLQNAQSTEEKQQAHEDLAKALATLGEQSKPGFSDAVQQAGPVVKGVKALLAGHGHKMQNIPLKQQQALAESLLDNPRLTKIANEIGRFQMLSSGFKKTKVKQAPGVADITQGAELEHVLASELAGLRHPILKRQFRKKYVEGKLAMYEHRGRDESGLGPMVICLDESGSMRSRIDEAKAFTLSLLLKAKRQKRDVVVIRFDDGIELREFPKGLVTENELVQFATSFLGGGTNFEKPLKEALAHIEKSMFKEADIVFITDGEADLTPQFLTNFQTVKKQKDFYTYGILIGSAQASLAVFCDEVASVKHLKERGVLQILRNIN